MGTETDRTCPNCGYRLFKKRVPLRCSECGFIVGTRFQMYLGQRSLFSRITVLLTPLLFFALVAYILATMVFNLIDPRNNPIGPTRDSDPLVVRFEAAVGLLMAIIFLVGCIWSLLSGLGGCPLELNTRGVRWPVKRGLRQLLRWEDIASVCHDETAGSLILVLRNDDQEIIPRRVFERWYSCEELERLLRLRLARERRESQPPQAASSRD